MFCVADAFVWRSLYYFLNKTFCLPLFITLYYFPHMPFSLLKKRKKRKKKKKDLWGLEKLWWRKERGDGKRKHNSLTWLYHIRRHMRHTKKKFTLLSWSFYKVINQLFLFLLDKNFNLISLFFFFFFFV